MSLWFKDFMNIALIFAGGVGKRMNNSTTPKQFLKVNNKEILVYTIEKFQMSELIDGIVLVSLNTYIEKCNELKNIYNLTKVVSIIPGGVTGQESIYNGLIETKRLYGDESIVLIHDGVRPIVTLKNIEDAIELTKEKGNAIPITSAIDTIAINSKDGMLGQIVERKNCAHAKAPQAFVLKDILKSHELAKKEGKYFIDSASMMQHYGYDLWTFECSADNIKITTPIDFFVFKGLIGANDEDVK